LIRTTFTAKLSERHQQKLVQQFPELQFAFFDSIEEATVALSETEVLVTYGEDLTEEMMASDFPRLKWIHVISAGLEKMPFDTISKQNIMVTNARGIHQIPMAEYTTGVMLQIVRKQNELYQQQLEGNWDRSIRTEELHGKTLGIIGVGAIGSKIAEYAKVMGMKVLGVNRSGQSVPVIDQLYTMERLDCVMEDSDFIVVIVPMTQETVGMIGERELSRMRSSAYLINISRGAIVDEQALLKVLQQKQIAGAVLDVFTQEPLPADHPFWSLDNTILTPHVSGRSPKYMERALELFIENVPVYLKGEGSYRNLIDPSKGY
jgi:phosphoglycerate dehydrogenase-like enzyme